MKIITALLVFQLFSAILFAQVMPVIKVETTENKTVSIPADLSGKYSLLCFAASQKAEADLESWLDPVYQKYIAKTGLMDDMFDVNTFFIPVLTGTNISFAASIKKKFRDNTQEDLRSHLLFCTENGKEVLAELNMKESSVPYFLLLDKNGNIIYRTSGKYTEDKFDSIDALIE